VLCFPRPPHRIPGEAKPVHARVDLQVDVERAAQGGLLEHLDLARVVNHRREVETIDNIEVAGLEYPFEQQNRVQEARLAQAHCLGEIEQGEAVSSTQGACGAQQAVPICVCLDHRPNPRARGRPSHHAEVVCEGGGVEMNSYGARHAGNCRLNPGRRRGRVQPTLKRRLPLPPDFAYSG
jgi:hypothetical protein